MRIALFQPDIPQNAAAVFRLAACLGIPVDVIEPCGFRLTDKAIRRVAMDYADHARVVRHTDWAAYRDAAAATRLILLTTAGDTPYTRLAYGRRDTLMVGRESAGAPPEVHDHATHRVVIPMMPGVRSLNVVTALAMVVGEACRQTGWPDRDHTKRTAP